jgi:peptidoglycan hydrolase-like protein with peptidoglycan-binding domain
MNDLEITPEKEPELTPAVVEEPAIVVAEPEVEPEVVVEAPKVVVDPKSKGAMPIPTAMVDLPEPAGPAVVSDGLVDPVYLSKAVYRNTLARKSLTVHHLQRRLNELGYSVAYADKDGWYGDGTQIAIDSFRADKKIEATGQIDKETFLAIFKNDPNVDPQD